MSLYVVDASVAAKWFVPELHTEAALCLLDGAHELLAPDLLVAETGNIVWKKFRRGEITQAEGRRILKALKVAPVKLEPSGPLLEPAFEIASGVGRTVYDSLYLALAVLRECRMVTADRKFFDALRKGPFGPNLAWVEGLTP